MKIIEFLGKLKGLDLQDGNLSDDDALALVKVAQQAARPKCNFLEIGSWKGKSTACFATVAAKENGVVWVVDHFKGAEGTKEAALAQHTDVLQIFKQNMQFVNSWGSIVIPIVANYKQIVPLLPSNFFNLIYIDADNRYPEMKFVLESFWKKVKPRGIICGRNLLYNYPDRKTFVDEEIDKEFSSKYMLHPGIIKAVYDIFKEDYQRVANSTVWYKVKKNIERGKK